MHHDIMHHDAMHQNQKLGQSFVEDFAFDPADRGINARSDFIISPRNIGSKLPIKPSARLQPFQLELPKAAAPLIPPAKILKAMSVIRKHNHASCPIAHCKEIKMTSLFNVRSTTKTLLSAGQSTPSRIFCKISLVPCTPRCCT